MRTPPAERTWGTDAAQIVIRQSRPITADELFEHFDWRGMELLDGYLVPKGAGLSHEEKAQDAALCIAAAKLKPLFADRADDLTLQSAKQHEIGFIVSSQAAYDETLERLDFWLAQDYREIWIFSPWYRQVSIHTAPRSYKNYRVGDILPGFSLPVADIFEN